MNNREIKFRLWHKEYNKIIDWTEFLFRRFTFDFLIKHSDKFIIQQFTGLTDKNGKEIYEGDIVQYLGLDGDSETKPEIVNWNQSWASFHIGDNCLSRSISKRFKIIGNIFENPELLK